MKKKHLFLIAMIASLIPLLCMFPLMMCETLFSVGNYVNWIVYYNQMVYTILHGALGEGINLLILLSESLGLLLAPLPIILALVFIFISFKKPKFIIPAYILSGLSLVIVGLSFSSTLAFLSLRHFHDLGFNISYIFAPLRYYYGGGYYSYDYIYQAIPTTAVNIAFHSLLMGVCLLSITVVILPFVLFVLSLIFVKDWKKKQKPEEPDVDIPLVEAEPLGEMKL